MKRLGWLVPTLYILFLMVPKIGRASWRDRVLEPV